MLAMDLHSGQCVGYFDIPVDHVYGDSVILDYLASKRISSGDLVVVSPDVGGVARARAFAKKVSVCPWHEHRLISQLKCSSTLATTRAEASMCVGGVWCILTAASLVVLVIASHRPCCHTIQTRPGVPCVQAAAVPRSRAALCSCVRTNSLSNAPGYARPVCMCGSFCCSCA